MASNQGGRVIVTIWAPESATPRKSGTSNGPAGIFKRVPAKAPKAARASVATNGPAAVSGNQTVAGRAPVPGLTQSRETTDATNATNTTRRYCIKATSRTSPPNASAISVMTVAAPGAEPRTAGGSGGTFQPSRIMPKEL